MALLRQASSLLRTAHRSAASSTRSLSTTSQRRGGHGPQYDPPTGWFLGIRPGQKYEREGWEWPMYIFCGSLVLTGAVMAFTPDTTVTTWALEEARRRLEAEGVISAEPQNGPLQKD